MNTECKDCELSNGDCGYHFKMNGVTNYDIASLSACDKYGNCMFFKSKAIDEESLKSKCKNCDYYNPYCEQFTNKPRGDGYCGIARMTSDGMHYINCTDEWSCADFCPKDEDDGPTNDKICEKCEEKETCESYKYGIEHGLIPFGCSSKRGNNGKHNNS